MATVLSMVASSCMPPMAMTAAMNRREGSQAGYQLVRVCLGLPHVHGHRAVAGVLQRLGPAARSASLRAVIAGYLTVILRTL